MSYMTSMTSYFPYTPRKLFSRLFDGQLFKNPQYTTLAPSGEYDDFIVTKAKVP